MAAKNIISALIILFTVGNLSAQKPEIIAFAGKIIRLDSANNAALAQRIARFQAAGADYFVLKQRCAVYFPVLEDELMKNGVHPDYKFLAAGLSRCIAGFSQGKEAGIWRIDRAIARENGLFIGPEEDDRLHVLRATKVAARAFALAERRFSQPQAVMAAFYENYAQAEKTEKGSRLLPEYLLETFALKKAFSNEQFPENQAQLLAYSAPGNKNLRKIARLTGTDPVLLGNYNPWLKAEEKNISAGKIVFLPADAATSADLAKKNGIAAFFPYESLNAEIAEPAETGIKNGLRIVYARPGDSPALLAQAGGISAENFRKFNELADFERLKTAGFYYLEAKKAQSVSTAYVLKNKETLWDAAHQNGILLSALLAYNKLKINSQAAPGTVLRLRPAGDQKLTSSIEIPDNSGDTPRLDLAFRRALGSDSATVTYKVRSGESLDDIAQKFQVSTRYIARENRLIGSALTVGETLKFKVRKINSEENLTLKAGQNPESFRIDTYTLLRYESLHQIADKLDISPDILANNNGGKSIDDQLAPGSRLTIRQNVNSYRASFGESIETIAKQFDVSPDLLSEITGKPRAYGVNLLGEQFDFQKVKSENQFLKAVSPRLKESPAEVIYSAPERKYHTLNYGENPYGIARKYNLKAGFLLEINNLSLEEATNLKPGDRLYLEAEK